MYPPRPARTTTSAIVERSPRITAPLQSQSATRHPQSAIRNPRSAIPRLSSPPPGVYAGAEDATGDDQQRQNEDALLLRHGHRDAAIVGFLRSDRNQVLLLRQPAHHVHEQVAVPGNAENGV